MVQASAAAHEWCDDEGQGYVVRRLGRAVAASLALHLCVMIAAAWVRLPQHGERPLASIEVALTSLQALPVKVNEPQKVRQKVQEKVRQKAVDIPQPPPPAKVAPAPAPVPELAPAPKLAPAPALVGPAKPSVDVRQSAPASALVAPVKPSSDVVRSTPMPALVAPVKPSVDARPSASVSALVAPARPSSDVMRLAPMPALVAPVKPSNDVMRDMMKKVELPPDAPKFGDVSPIDKPKKAPLKLPDVPVGSEIKETVSQSPNIAPRSSLTEDLTKELDEELKKIKQLEFSNPAPAEVVIKPAPQTEAKALSVKAVDTTLKVPGIAPGSNAYLGRVRQRISSFWSAPPVDVGGRTYVVIVQFRLHRNGTVSGVAIERSSGNEYYDLAGKRAVLSAIPLPTFPPELVEFYFDAHFTFTVGESQG